jgi:hypothetical protein
MSKELIREEPIFEDIEIEELTEDEDGSLKLLTIRGTASRGDVFNKNNRMYPTKVLKKVAEKAQTAIKKGKMTGQLDHPSFFDGGGLKGTAIKFTNMWMEDDYLKFEGNVIPTTPGKELAVLLKSRVGVGMSTRGYGTMLPHKNKGGKEDNSRMVVQDDYELLGVDAVLNESNQYSKIAQFEHKEGGKNVDELTLEMLKKDHPELVDAVRQELISDVEKDFDKKVSEAVETKLEEQKETVRKEIMDSDEVKGMQEFINSIVEAVKPLMPGQKEYEESVKQKEIDDLKAKLEAAETAKETAAKEASELKVAKEAEEAKQKVIAHIEAKVEGHRFAEQLKTRLSECVSVEDVDDKFDQEVAFIDGLIKVKEDPEGTGVITTESKDDVTKIQTELDEKKERERTLAGLPSKKEGGK